MEDRDPGGAAAHFDQRDAQLLLVFRQHRVRRGQGLEHQVRHAIPGALHALAQVLRGRRLHRHEVHLDLEAHPRHPDRVHHAVLLVDHVLMRDVVQQLVVPPQGHRARYFVDARHVLPRDLFPRHRHHARGGPRRHVLAGDPARDAAHLRPRHPLGVAHRGHDRPRRLIDVADHAAPHAGIPRQAHAEHLRHRRARQVADHFGDHRARLRAAEVEPGHEPTIAAHAPGPPPSTRARRRTTTWPA